MNTMITRLTTLLTIGIITVHCGHTQNDDFKNWDKDNDGVINYTEFESGMKDEGLFTRYDTSGDGVIDQEEWKQARKSSEYIKEGYFTSWDQDNNGSLSKHEFIKGAYETWDTNGNDGIDTLEYNNNYADWITY